MSITLLPCQVAAIKFLEKNNGRGLLWMAVGRGKSFAGVGYCHKHVTGRTLIFCNSSAKKQWSDEIERFTGNKATVIDGTRAERVEQYSNPKRFIVLNYELLDRDLDLILQVKPEAIIADESHRLKSATSKRYKKFRQIKTPVRIAMTGTFLPNDLWEAWTTVDWIRPGTLCKNFWQFKMMYCHINPHIKGKIDGYRDREHIESVIRSISFRVKQSAERRANLTNRTVLVNIREDERVLYKQIKEEARLAIEGMAVLQIPNVLAELMRLRQVIDVPSVFGIERVGSKEDALDNLINGSIKTIVFSEFKTVVNHLAEKYQMPRIAGGMSLAEREAAIIRFKTDASAHTIFMTAAGAESLNLQAATRVIHYGVPYNWARIEQRTGRANREGQDKPVEEIFLLAYGTIDTKMMKLVLEKRDLSQKASPQDYLSLLDD